jgi:hypothetical protein
MAEPGNFRCYKCGHVSQFITGGKTGQPATWETCGWCGAANMVQPESYEDRYYRAAVEKHGLLDSARHVDGSFWETDGARYVWCVVSATEGTVPGAGTEWPRWFHRVRALTGDEMSTYLQGRTGNERGATFRTVGSEPREGEADVVSCENCGSEMPSFDAYRARGGTVLCKGCLFELVPTVDQVYMILVRGRSPILDKLVAWTSIRYLDAGDAESHCEEFIAKCLRRVVPLSYAGTVRDGDVYKPWLESVTSSEIVMLRRRVVPIGQKEGANEVATGS